MDASFADNNNVIAFWEKPFIQPEWFSDKSFYPVSSRRVSYPLADRNPQSGKNKTVFAEKDRKMACFKSLAGEI